MDSRGEEVASQGDEEGLREEEVGTREVEEGTKGEEAEEDSTLMTAELTNSQSLEKIETSTIKEEAPTTEAVNEANIQEEAIEALSEALTHSKDA